MLKILPKKKFSQLSFGSSCIHTKISVDRELSFLNYMRCFVKLTLKKKIKIKGLHNCVSFEPQLFYFMFFCNFPKTMELGHELKISVFQVIKSFYFKKKQRFTDGLFGSSKAHLK